MPRNVYWELYYHFVWRTKDSLPLLKPAVEKEARKFLIHRALETQEAIVHAVGGIEDHVHMAVSLPPTVQLATWIGELKGACSHAVNHGHADAGRSHGRADTASCPSARAISIGLSPTSRTSASTTGEGRPSSD